MALPNPKQSSHGSGSRLPTPEAGGDFDPFLNAGVIGKVGAKATITICGLPEVRETEFSDLQIPVKFKNKKYSWGMKFSSGNYSRMFQRFGDNVKKWKGAVKVEVKHFKKNDYVAVV